MSEHARESSVRTYQPGDHEIELASGRYLDLSRPDPAVITIEDVAHGLANTCRYAGHTVRFYSVAEHARLVAARLRVLRKPVEIQLAGLHHDDAEAFVADVARPLKTLLQPAYGEISARLDAAVWEALDLPSLAAAGYGKFAWADVKAADDWALACEAYHLMPSRGEGWWSEGLYDPADPGVMWVDSLGQAPEHARWQFLQADRILRRELQETAA